MVWIWICKIKMWVVTFIFKIQLIQSFSSQYYSLCKILLLINLREVLCPFRYPPWISSCSLKHYTWFCLTGEHRPLGNYFSLLFTTESEKKRETERERALLGGQNDSRVKSDTLYSLNKILHDEDTLHTVKALYTLSQLHLLTLSLVILFTPHSLLPILYKWIVSPL